MSLLKNQTGLGRMLKRLATILLGYLPLQDPDFLELQRLLDPSLEACPMVKTSQKTKGESFNKLQ